MLKSYSLLGALLLPSLALAPGEVRLAFHVTEGTTLTTSSERVLTLELQEGELTMNFDGQEHGGEAPDVELTLVEKEELVFRDEYAKLSEGRAGSITRHFETLATTSQQSLTDPEGEEHEEETPGTSELEGTTVVFTLDEDDGSYGVAYAEDVEDGDEALLADLDAVADFSWYLPAEAVEVDDTWPIDLDAFRHTGGLSGDLHIVREGDEEDPDDDFGEQFDDHLDGELEGRLVEVVEEDGRRIAVIAIQADLTTEIEQTEDLEIEDGEGELTRTFEFSFELTGELRWDVDGGHCAALTLSGDVGMELTEDSEIHGSGHTIEITQKQDFEGTVTYEITVE
ncbi:MAG: hypothetical protein H6828_08455 [Planctomycetes bacterium]|nr:hypothetical protein [Planctomycetota bacterium]